MADACEEYVDQLRRLRHVIISDNSIENGRQRLADALASLRTCATSVVAGLTNEVPLNQVSDTIRAHAERLQKSHALKNIRPIARVAYAQCEEHLQTLAEQYEQGQDQAAADVLLNRTFGGISQEYQFRALTNYLRQEHRIAMTPLAADSFLMALVDCFHQRLGSHVTFPLGIAATDPYPGQNYGFERSHCLLPEVNHQKCIVMTDINHDGVTRRECYRILRETYPEADAA
jgi:hypothetical protein